MNIAFEKTFTLILLMVLGFILKSKIKNHDQVNGIKEIVLTVSLPAMIFIALMNIHIDRTLVWVPIITLAFNFFLYWVIPHVLPLFGVEKNTSTSRTLTLLVPSLAPGLSCFPFITEFLGEKSLAIAALADVGNKFFVLIFLYLVALNMFLKVTNSQVKNSKEKIKELLIGLVKEPINIVMISAFVLLSLNIHFENLPVAIKGVADKCSAMMTPLILIYIGLAVQLKKGIKRIVLSVLSFRAGLTLLFSTFIIYIFNIQEPSLALMAIVIPQSSVSFWPFAHIALFNKKEMEVQTSNREKTFNLDQAVLTLAISLPFSTAIILGILSSGETFLNPWITLTTGSLLLLSSIVIPLLFKNAFISPKTAYINKEGSQM